MQKLRDLGQLDETLVVLTTDMAVSPRCVTTASTRPAAATSTGTTATQNGTYLSPSPSLAPLIATGNVRLSYQDSAIRTWLTDTSDAAKRAAAGVMASMPDVIASYRLDGRRYRLVRANRGLMTRAERRYWPRRAQRIIDTMAAPYAADVVGLLKDNASYGVAGDHGGAQRPVQRIPIVFYGAGAGSRDSVVPLRSVDIMPTILRTMGIRPDADVDGRAVRLPRTGLGAWLGR